MSRTAISLWKAVRSRHIQEREPESGIATPRKSRGKDPRKIAQTVLEIHRAGGVGLQTFSLARRGQLEVAVCRALIVCKSSAEFRTKLRIDVDSTNTHSQTMSCPLDRYVEID